MNKKQFVDYLEASRSCHVARSYLHDCEEPVAHAEYMCNYLKAKEYHQFYNVPDCVKEMANEDFLPIVADIEYYCNYQITGGQQLVRASLIGMILLLAGWPFVM